MKALVITTFFLLTQSIYAQKLLIPNVSSTELNKKFAQLHFLSDKNDSVDLQLEIRHEDDIKITSQKTIWLKKGKNTLSFFDIFDPSLVFSDTLAKSFYDDYGMMLPGSYQSFWSVGDQVIATHSWKHDFFEFPAKIHQPHRPLEDSIQISWSNDRFNKEDVTYVLAFKPLSKGADSLMVRMQDTTILLSRTLFRPNGLYAAKLKVYYHNILLGKSPNGIRFVPRPGKKMKEKMDAITDLKSETNLPGNAKPQLSTLSTIKSNIQPYGNLKLEHYYTSNAYAYSYLGNQYTIGSGQVGLDIKGIPIRANVLVTNMGSDSWRLADFSVQLDADRLRSNLEQALRDKVEHNKQELLANPKIPLDFDTLNKDVVKNRALEAGEKYKPGELDSVNQRLMLVNSQLDEYNETITQPKMPEDTLPWVLNTPDVAGDTLVKSQIVGSGKKYDSLSSNAKMTQDQLIAERDKLTSRKQELDTLKLQYEKTQRAYEKYTVAYNEYRSLKNNGLGITELTPDAISDPKLLTSFLPASAQKYGDQLLKIREFELGWTHGNFSDLSLSQLPVKGVHLTYGDQNSVEVLQGKTVSGFSTFSGLSNPTFSHKLMAARVELLRNSATGVNFHYLDFRNPDIPYTGIGANRVLGVEARQALAGRWQILAEYNRSHSLTAANHLMSSFELSWADLVDLNNSTKQAWSLGLEFNGKGGTHYSIKYREIGAGYQTMGNPFLFSDRKGFALEASKTFLKEKIMAFSHFSREQNDLSNQFTSTGEFWTARAGLTARLSEKMNATILAMPSFQQYGENHYQVWVINGSMDATQKLGSVNCLFQAGYSLQESIIWQTHTSHKVEMLTSNFTGVGRRGSKLNISFNTTSGRSTFKQQNLRLGYSYRVVKTWKQDWTISYFNQSVSGSRSFLRFKNDFVLFKKLQVGASVGLTHVQRWDASKRFGIESRIIAGYRF